MREGQAGKKSDCTSVHLSVCLLQALVYYSSTGIYLSIYIYSEIDEISRFPTVFCRLGELLHVFLRQDRIFSKGEGLAILILLLIILLVEGAVVVVLEILLLLLLR